jgi:hypothetical protein
MPIALTQSVTGNGASLTLNGVASQALLTFFDSYFRSTTGLAEPVPTDTQGTWSIGSSGVPGIQTGGSDTGTGIFYQAAAASGTHTVTPQANADHNATMCEWSGIATSLPLDASANAKTDVATPVQTQVTGTTGFTVQANELILISVGIGGVPGLADIALTDPVPGFTTLQKVSNDASNVGAFHAYKIVSATGTQSATFNWVDGTSSTFCGAAIATFKAASTTPAIIQQPSDGNAVIGDAETFNVVAVGATDYQWQDNSSGSFADISGATSSSYTTVATTSAMQRRQYRCNVTNASGTTTSAAAVLTLSWYDVYLYAMPENADPDDVRLRDPTAFSGNVTLALTGVSATSTAGSLTPVNTTALVGSQVASTAGAVVANVSPALSGIVVATAAGTVIPANTLALIGNAAAGSPGTVTASQGSTAALTGVQSTSASGTLTPVLSVPLVGSAATGSNGTVSPASSVSLTGQAATGSAGTATPSISVALTGIAATFTAGTVSPQASVALVGTANSALAGTVTPSGSFALTGQATTSAAGTVLAQISVPLTGVAITPAAGTIAPANTKALTGTAAVASPGTVTPNTTLGLLGTALTGTPGSVSFSASDVSAALTGISTSGQTGSITASISVALTGNSTTGFAGTVAAQSSVALTGQAATAVAGTVTAQPSLALSGNQSAGAAGSVQPQSSVALSGQFVTVSAGTITAQTTIALSGNQAAGGAGTVAPSVGTVIALTGVACSAQVGALGVSRSNALTGSAFTGEAGILARFYGFSNQHASWLESIARLHGLIDPLTVTPTSQGDGTVVQTLSENQPIVTVTTITAPVRFTGDGQFPAEYALMLEKLARLYGLVAPLQVTTTGRTDGTLTQTIDGFGTDTQIVETL